MKILSKLRKKLFPTKHILHSSKSMQITCDMSETQLEDILFLDRERIDEIYDKVDEEGFNVMTTPPHHLLYVFSKYCKHPNELTYFSFVIGLHTTVEITER